MYFLFFFSASHKGDVLVRGQCTRSSCATQALIASPGKQQMNLSASRYYKYLTASESRTKLIDSGWLSYVAPLYSSHILKLPRFSRPNWHVTFVTPTSTRIPESMQINEQFTWWWIVKSIYAISTRFVVS